MRRRLLGIAALGAVLVAACGDDDSSVPDAQTADARIGADSSEILADAGEVTECGESPNRVDCDRVVEICVLTDVGGSLQPSCEPCDQEGRDCASCGALCGALTCADSPDDNTIECFQD